MSPKLRNSVVWFELNSANKTHKIGCQYKKINKKHRQNISLLLAAASRAKKSTLTSEFFLTDRTKFSARKSAEPAAPMFQRWRVEVRVLYVMDAVRGRS